MRYKIAQLTLTSAQKLGGLSEIYVAQPDADKEELAGKLFLLIEIDLNKSDNFKIINFLIENLVHNYYQNEKMVLRERIKTVKISQVFESAISKTNKNLADFLKAEKINLGLNLINATAGVVFEDELHFSNIGKNKALLIFKSKKRPGQAAEGYGLVEIIKHSEKKPETARVQADGETLGKAEQKQLNIHKLFSNVISGSIPMGGFVFFTNEALPEYLSHKQLIEIITALPPASAVEQIKNLLSKVNSYVSFQGLIIKNVTKSEGEEPKKDIIRPSSTQASILNLNAVEEKTEKFLTPGGYLNFGKLGNAFSLVMPDFLKFKNKKPLSMPLKDKIFFRKRNSSPLFSRLMRAGRSLASYAIALALYAFKGGRNFVSAFFQREGRDRLMAGLKNQINGSLALIRRALSWFKNLSKKNKILLAVAVACLALLFQNLIMTHVKNRQAEQDRLTAELAGQIEQKENQIEASLLYNNEEGARQLLEQIQELLARFPNQAKARTQYASLFNKLDEQNAKINKSVSVRAEEKIADMAAFDQTASPASLNIFGDKIYLADPAKGNIYGFDPKSKSIAALNQGGTHIGSLESPSQEDGNLYFLDGDKILKVNTKDNSLKEIGLVAEGDVHDINSIAIFNNKLYALNKNNGQIYIYKKEGDNFSSGLPWIKEQENFSNVVSFGIDGAIYILKNDGQVEKYLKGRKEDFALDGIIPPMSQAAKIFVGEKSLYIFEPSNKRLAVFDKKGKLIIQYRFENLDDLKDFAVDEKTDLIYLLDGTSIFKFKAGNGQ